MKLLIIHQDSVVLAEPIGASALSVGRSSSNAVVLRGEGVSGHHAMLYREGGQVWIRDLQSTNGTFVNGEHVRAPMVVCAGDALRFGTQMEAKLAVNQGPAPVSCLRLEQADGPIAWAIDQSLFSIPGAPQAILRVGDDEVWLVLDGQERARIDPNVPFVVGDQSMVLRLDPRPADTVRPAMDVLPYTLNVDLHGDSAELTDGRHLAQVTTPNRVALLHVLGTAWLDQPRGRGRGWVPDGELGLAVWGRAHRGNLPNNLNVLIHRIRRTVEGAGLDRWFIERRTGATRVRVERVEVC